MYYLNTETNRKQFEHPMDFYFKKKFESSKKNDFQLMNKMNNFQEPLSKNHQFEVEFSDFSEAEDDFHENTRNYQQL